MKFVDERIGFDPDRFAVLPIGLFFRQKQSKSPQCAASASGCGRLAEPVIEFLGFHRFHPLGDRLDPRKLSERFDAKEEDTEPNSILLLKQERRFAGSREIARAIAVLPKSLKNLIHGRPQPIPTQFLDLGVWLLTVVRGP